MAEPVDDHIPAVVPFEAYDLDQEEVSVPVLMPIVAFAGGNADTQSLAMKELASDLVGNGSKSRF